MTDTGRLTGSRERSQSSLSSPAGFDPGRDERGIDLAIAAFLAARMCGGTTEEATRDATAMLTMFGFEPTEK